MKKITLSLFIFALSLLGSYNGSSIFANECSNGSEVQSDLISMNINFVKSSICKKIEKAESNLKKYKNNLSNSQNGSEIQTWLKKIHKTENIIKNLNDTLLGINIAENRVYR